DLTIAAIVGGQPQELSFQSTVDIETNRVFVIENKPPAAAVSPAAGANTDGDLDRLMSHLNANRVYYTTALIAGADGGSRYLVMSALTDRLGNRLVDYVSYTPA